MRILITNDDGIQAVGLTVLSTIARKIAGPQGEVWTVAPSQEKSGVGHCISYANPALLTRLDDKRFMIDGYPADCVLAAVHEIMSDTPPDLILSGVNRGNNSAENVLYSGTIGAAMEGALQGIPSIALSQYYGPENLDLDDPFDAAQTYGASVIEQIIAQHTDDTGPYRLFYNVNFPPVAAADVKGTLVAAQGRRPDVTFKMTQHPSPTGRKYLWAQGGAQATASGEGTDATANLDGFISITPLRADLTCYKTLDKLQLAIK